MHTVTQAFRHSLAQTHTISVTFHYMVLAWIAGLETYQISRRGHCRLNHAIVFKRQCRIVFYLLISCLKYQYIAQNGRLCKRCVRSEVKTSRQTSDWHCSMRWIFMLAGLGFGAGSCLRSLHAPPSSTLLCRISTGRLVKKTPN